MKKYNYYYKRFQKGIKLYARRGDNILQCCYGIEKIPANYIRDKIKLQKFGNLTSLCGEHLTKKGRDNLGLEVLPGAETWRKEREMNSKEKIELLREQIKTLSREMFGLIANDKAKEMLSELKTADRIMLEQHCNCGGQIRHNNGGNYHDRGVLELSHDGRYYFAEWTTCELCDGEEERIIDAEEAHQVLKAWLGTYRHDEVWIEAAKSVSLEE